MADDLNDDLDSYISKRRKSSPFKSLFGVFRSSSSALDPSLQPYKDSSPQITPSPLIPDESVVSLQSSSSSSVVENSPASDAANASDVSDTSNNSNWFSRLKSHFSTSALSSPSVENASSIASNGFESDLKEIAGISLSAFKRLSPNELSDFKSTEDFARFKELLRKYNVIK